MSNPMTAAAPPAAAPPAAAPPAAAPPAAPAGPAGRFRTEDILGAALAWQHSGHPVALATVVNTWGSAPRPVGSLLAVGPDGAFHGSVSGGCVEAAVVREAQQAIGDGRGRLLTFGVTDDEAWSVGLACGGTIRVVVAPLQAGDALPRQMADALSRRQRAAVAYGLGDDPRPRWVSAEALPADARHSGTVADAAGSETFLHVLEPRWRLWIVGGVHVAQVLAPMAAMLDYDVAVIDPRPQWANAERFPGVRLIDAWPDAALPALGLDRQTAVVTLTHDAKFDDPALIAALQADTFYVGALGSRKTHAKRLDRLSAGFLEASDLARIAAPIGLPIGALSPAEIAVSILAQITQRRRQAAEAAAPPAAAASAAPAAA